MKIGVSIFITFSRAMALLVLIVGSIFSYLNHNPEVMIFTLSLAGGLAGLKSWSDGMTKRKEIDKKPTDSEVG